MFSGIISALGNVKNITYNDIYSVDIEITKINLEDFEKLDDHICSTPSIRPKSVADEMH